MGTRDNKYLYLYMITKYFKLHFLTTTKNSSIIDFFIYTFSIEFFIRILLHIPWVQLNKTLHPKISNVRGENKRPY